MLRRLNGRVNGHHPRDPDDDAKVKAQTIKTLARKPMPCVLCGRELLHGAVWGDRVEEIFRAQTDEGAVVWVPVKDADHLAHCPDPPPETRLFWRDRVFREGWKKRQRARMEALRAGGRIP